jgi:hypothetical protein
MRCQRGLYTSIDMRSIPLIAALTILAFSQDSGPYKILKTAKVGGAGGFDYVYADSAGRRLYIPRTGTGARISVFNLDTLDPVGEISNANARGARRHSVRPV